MIGNNVTTNSSDDGGLPTAAGTHLGFDSQVLPWTNSGRGYSGSFRNQIL